MFVQPTILPMPTMAPMPWRSMTRLPCSPPAGPAWSARTGPARARCSRLSAGCSSRRRGAFHRRSLRLVLCPSRRMLRPRASRSSPATTGPRPCALRYLLRHRRRVAVALRHAVARRAQANPDSMRPGGSLIPCSLRFDEPTNHLDADTRDLVARTLRRVSEDGPARIARPRAARRFGHLVRVRGPGARRYRARLVLPGEGADRPARRTLAEERANARRELGRLRGGNHPSGGSGSPARPHGDRPAISTGTTTTGARRSSWPSIPARMARPGGSRRRWGRSSSAPRNGCPRRIPREGVRGRALPRRRALPTQGSRSPRGRVLGAGRGAHAAPSAAVRGQHRPHRPGRAGTARASLRCSPRCCGRCRKRAWCSFPGDQGATRRATCLPPQKVLEPASRGRLLSIVARLDSPPTRILEGDDLSPGEMRKLLLA